MFCYLEGKSPIIDLLQKFLGSSHMVTLTDKLWDYLVKFYFLKPHGDFDWITLNILSFGEIDSQHCESLFRYSFMPFFFFLVIFVFLGPHCCIWRFPG